MKALDYQPFKLERKSLPEENKSDLKEPMKLKKLKWKEIQKSLWFKSPCEDFNLLIKDISDNLDNGTTMNKRVCDLRNAEKFLLGIISENKSLELSNDLIKGDIAALKSAKIRDEIFWVV